MAALLVGGASGVARPLAAAADPTPAPAFQITTATEQQILGHVPADLTIFRFADEPRILVLEFASLREQGRMFNRLAAFVEKAGLPHNRLLSEREIDTAIRRRGVTVATFYYGHDYAADAVARFFEAADREHVALNQRERMLRALLRQQDWLAPGITASVISLPAAGADITAAAHAAILRHELAHGAFFSDAAYAAYVRDFWQRVLTVDERSAFRRFLGRKDYDVGLEGLMYNEMQAYLMFTPDPAYFDPAIVGLSAPRAAALRAQFFAAMPGGWLRNIMAQEQSAAQRR